LERDVIAELTWDPKIDSQAVDVSVADGTVTLRGASASTTKHGNAGSVSHIAHVPRDR
jgi:osmotically-inducible protein OsmY